MILIVCCLAQLIEIIDITVVNVAISSIERSLHFSYSDLQWVVSAYTVPYGGLLLLGGRAGDLLGRRRVFSWGLACFGLASLLSGLAPTAGALVSTRALQGMAAAFTAPMTLSILAVTFPEGRPRNRALAIWGSTMAVGFSFGLIAGGLLVTGPGWRWIFLVNVPICLVMLAGVACYLPADRPPRRHRGFDLAGAVTVTVGTSLLIYTISGTATVGWLSPRTILLLILSGLLLTYFAGHEKWIAAEPLVPRSLLRNLSVVGANIISALTSCTIFAVFYVLSLEQQQVLGYSPLKTGLDYLPIATVVMVSSGLAPILVPRLGLGYLLASGGLIAFAGCLLATGITPSGGALRDIIVPSVVIGLGAGIMAVPTTIAAVADVPEGITGSASSLLNVTRQMGGALGLAVISTVAAQHAARLMHHHVTLPSALNDGFRLGFTICAGLMAVTAVVSLALFRRSGRGQRMSMNEIASLGVES
jgi:EmrB/QacA subfamily drug resistance transporter